MVMQYESGSCKITRVVAGQNLTSFFRLLKGNDARRNVTVKCGPKIFVPTVWCSANA